MINQVSVTDLRGQQYQVNGNEPILLDDSQTVWVIQSGSVALFAVTVKDGEIKGTRRYLFGSDSQEALFGTTPVENFASLLMAVPIGEVELLKVDRECFGQLVAEGDARIVTWIENWLGQIDASISHISPPAESVRAIAPGRFSLNDGETLQPEAGAIAWVQMQQGNVWWMGLEKLTLDSTGGIFPLSEGMWLQAVQEVQLTTDTTSAIPNPDILLKGLSQVHILILQYILLLEQQETEEELQRLHDRERLNRQVTAEALGDLISPLMPQQANFFMEGAPLLVAAGAVGRSLGVTIRPPARSEDLKRVKNPLEAIVRASRLRMRQVLLRDDWWNKDCGPLITYTQEDNQPMALLPVSASSYEVFDPVERTRVPVDERIASTLIPIAYMFYRSLPDKILKAVDVLRFALWGLWGNMLVIFVTGIAATLLGMLTPQATAILIDNAIPDSDRGLLLQVGLGLLFAALATGVFQLTQGFALLRLETVSDASTQAAVWDRLLNLPVSFFRQYTTGDLHSRVTSVSTIRRLLSGTTLIALITNLFALLNLVLLFYYSWNLALVAVAVSLVSLAVTTFSGMILIRKVRPLLEVEGNIFGQTVQLINGISKLRVAGADDVTAMPMQMHTVISEGGGNLSGGQRQRLLIARALALKPRILLFDEATSALDNRTQAIVSESLDKLQVTRIVIAHRLSTIRNAHRIYVLQAGRVIQKGSFEELASQEGLFAQLMARQMA